MIAPAAAIGLVLALFALAAVVVQLAAALVVSRFRRRQPKGLGWAPPVTVLVPGGSDGDVAHSLDSLCRQSYPGPVRYVVALDRDDDLADLRDAWPKADIVAVPIAEGGGERAILLDTMARQGAATAVVVLADPRLSVPPDWLRSMVAPLQSRAVGVVACTSRALAADTSLRTRTAALTVNTRLLPALLMSPRAAARHGLGRDTLAVRPDDLERLGGFRGLLSPRRAPAEAVRDRLGLRLHLAPTLPQRRVHDAPAPRPGIDLPFWHPLPLALAVVPLLPDVGLVLTAAALISRWLVALAAGARPLALLPVRDILALIPFAHAPARRASLPPPVVPAE